MACLNKRANGTFRIIVTNGEKQKNIYLGKMPKKTAELCLSMVERITSAQAAGVPLDTETAAWTARIDDRLHEKLVKAGVLQQRQRRTLGDFITQYISEHPDWKPRTLSGFQTAANKMLAYFGKDTSLDVITADQCNAFKADLLRKNAPSHTAKIIERGRGIFREAVERKMLADNPFVGIKAGRKTNVKRQHFVTVDETVALLDACRNARQRLIIVLARYGGLRCPSELVGLLWSEVDWEKKRFIVHSPKTEHHKGGDYRVVPLFPEIEAAMSELWETLPEGADDRIYPEMTAKKSLGAFIAKTAKRAGIELWTKPFQNMRSSQATELVAMFPAHVVNKIMEHTEAVAMAHYRQVLDSDFEKLSALVTDKKSDDKHGKESTNPCRFWGHAVLGLNGVETENLRIDVTSKRTIGYNKMKPGAKAPKLPRGKINRVPPRGIEPLLLD